MFLVISPLLGNFMSCFFVKNSILGRAPKSMLPQVKINVYLAALCFLVSYIGKSSVFHNLATAKYTHYFDYYACYDIFNLTENSAKIYLRTKNSLTIKL